MQDKSLTLSDVLWERKLTQARFAELTGIHPMTLSRWTRKEKGVGAPGRLLQKMIIRAHKLDLWDEIVLGLKKVN